MTAPKPDYEDIFVGIKWDMDKTSCLLDDLQGYFDSPDLESPPRDRLEAIRYDYKSIAVKIGLLQDLANKVGDIMDLLL